METRDFLSLRHRSVLLCVVMHAALFGQFCAAQHTSWPRAPERGMIFEKGTWRAPTADEAMQMLMALGDDYGSSTETVELVRAENALYAMIQQGLESDPRINLDAFVRDLFQIWIWETGWRMEVAQEGLLRAGKSNYHDGSPYLGVANELIRVYESIEDYPTLNANGVLYMLTECGGVDYVWNVFTSTPKPPVCSRTSVYAPDNPCPNISPWCDTGKFLIGKSGGPEKEEWEALCKWDEIITH